MEFDVDVNLDPAANEAAWACIRVVNGLNGTNLVATRVVLRSSTPSGATFAPDSTTPFPYAAPVNSGSASGYCQTGGTRLVNADVGTAHVWLDTRTDSGGTRESVCLRGQMGSSATGGRLTVDGGGSQTFLTLANANPATDFGECTIPIVGLSTPPLLVKAGAGDPAYACITLLSTSQRLTVTSSGSQTVAGFTSDS